MSTVYGYLHHTLDQSSPALSMVLKWIPYFPIAARKVFLTVAQTGLDDQDTRIHSAALACLSCIGRGPDGEHIGRRLLFDLIRETSRTPFNRSLVMLMVRCESALVDDGSDEVLIGGLNKEVQASQNVFSEGQTINYSTLFGNGRDPWSVEAPITPAWSKNASWLANALSKNMADLSGKILYPRCQRRKNMSQSSCISLQTMGYTHDTLEPLEWRTVDLEIHNYRTGMKGVGDIEMRWAWKYNDLKPRVYYCTGADAYWRSRYMRLVAVVLMDSWPMTHSLRRRDPDLLTYFMEENDYLTMWDYESFTTTLSELKFFVYWMSRYLEQDNYVHQHPLRLFDWRLGVVEMPIHQLLDEYNENINVFERFSIHRVVDVLGMSGDISLAQHNSGSLGVLGNIGLSTALHGIHIGPIVTSKEKGVSVGDDAFAFQKKHPREQLIPHIQRIGRINEEKFEILKPIRSEIEVQVWKFLKRRLTRDDHGIHLDVLYDFPVFANVFGVVSQNRTVRREDKERVIHKFVSQVGSLFWAMSKRGYDFAESEVNLLMEMLLVCYRKLNLRFHGSLPGTMHSDGFILDFAVPPILFFDPSSEDWAEFLWDRSPEKYCLLPLHYGVPVYPEEFQYVGQTFDASGHQLLSVLEDLGVLQKSGMLKGYVDVSSENRWLFKKTVDGSISGVYSFLFLSEPPSYYNDVVKIIAGAVQDPPVVDVAYGLT